MTATTIQDAPPEGRTPDRVDIHVGLKMRQRRKAIGVSQEHLADNLGLTFQQVQKYERGANRVSASKLYQAAQALQVPISFFFDGLPDPADGNTDAGELGDDPFLVMSGLPYGPTVARDFARMATLDRSLLAGLARRFADGAGDLPAAAIAAGMGGEELSGRGSEINSQAQLRAHYRRAS